MISVALVNQDLPSTSETLKQSRLIQSSISPEQPCFCGGIGSYSVLASPLYQKDSEKDCTAGLFISPVNAMSFQFQQLTRTKNVKEVVDSNRIASVTCIYLASKISCTTTSASQKP
jgi:hypothetical protein